MIKLSRRKTTLGDALIAAGVGTLSIGAPAAMILSPYISQIRKYRASERFRNALENSPRARRKDLRIPRYAHNRLDDELPSVFDDEEKALDTLYPDWRERNFIRRHFLKARIKSLIENPQFVKKYNAVFLRKGSDPRVLAHELGHATDNAKSPLSLWQRSPFHPKAFGKFLVDPENTPLMTQERNAWDNGGVPEDDELRRAALDTYREAQKSIKRPFKYGLNVAALGALLAGAGVVTNYVGKKFSR